MKSVFIFGPKDHLQLKLLWLLFPVSKILKLLVNKISFSQ